MKKTATIVAVLALVLPASAFGYYQGEESGDPCYGHQVGDWWTDASGGSWTCTSWGTDGKRASGPY